MQKIGSELEFNVPFQHKHGYIRDEEDREMSARGGPASSVADRMSSGLKDRPDSMPQLLNEISSAAPAQNCQRMVVLGSAKVGKSAIVRRFLSNCFDEKYTPTIEDFHRKVYRIRGESYRLDILDTYVPGNSHRVPGNSYRLDILDTSGNNPFPAMKRLSLLTGYFVGCFYRSETRHNSTHSTSGSPITTLSLTLNLTLILTLILTITLQMLHALLTILNPINPNRNCEMMKSFTSVSLFTKQYDLIPAKGGDALKLGK